MSKPRKERLEKDTKRKADAFLSGFLYHHPIFAVTRCPLCEQRESFLIFHFQYSREEFLTGQCIFCRGTVFGFEAITKYLYLHPVDRKLMKGTQQELNRFFKEYEVSSFVNDLKPNENEHFSAFLKIYGEQK